jgi:hypothetical protein
MRNTSAAPESMGGFWQSGLPEVKQPAGWACGLTPGMASTTLRAIVPRIMTASASALGSWLVSCGLTMNMP